MLTIFAIFILLFALPGLILFAVLQVNRSRRNYEVIWQSSQPDLPTHKVLPDRNATIAVRLGTVIEYRAKIYPSVGLNYRAEYDKDAFDVTRNVVYDRPKDVEAGMCGSDSGVCYTFFKTLKKGRYSLRIVHDYRGNVQRTVDFKIKVK